MINCTKLIKKTINGVTNALPYKAPKNGSTERAQRRIRKQIAKLEPSDLVVIHLSDITFLSSWLQDAVAQDAWPAECAACGWFVNADDFNIRLTTLVAGDGEKDVHIFPIGVITHLKHVKYDKDY